MCCLEKGVWHDENCFFFLSVRVFVVRGSGFFPCSLMLALFRCHTAVRWRSHLRCSAFSLVGATNSSQRSTIAGPQFLRTQTALFHQSEAKASPDPNKPSTGKHMYDCLYSYRPEGVSMFSSGV